MLFQKENLEIENEDLADSAIDPYSSFDPRAYISEYYSSLGEENAFLLSFYHDVFNKLPNGLRMLELGGGPTVYQLFSASRKTTEIIFTDFLPSNLKEVSSWLKNEPGAFSWEQFSRTVAELEYSNASDLIEKTSQVESRTRKAVKQLLSCDALSEKVIPVNESSQFDIVSSGFCLECISNKEEEFIKALTNVAKRVASHGYLILTLLKNSRRYKVAGKNFPAFPIDSAYIKKLLPKLGFRLQEVRESLAEQDQGYEGLIALVAQRTA